MRDAVKLVLLWPANTTLAVIANQIGQLLRETGIKPLIQTDNTNDGADVLAKLIPQAANRSTVQVNTASVPAPYAQAAGITFTGTLLDPIVNVAYTDSHVAIVGGVVPFTCTAHTTPAGIPAPTVSGRTVTFAGTPTVAASTTWSATFTDANGNTGTFTQTVDVEAVITVTGTLADGTHNVAYSQTLTLGGGDTPYAISTQTLPTGLTAVISGSSVNVTGTHTTADATASSITGTDAEGHPWSYSRTITFG